MLRKNLIRIIDLLILLVSLLLFILAETKTVSLFYPWHMAVCYALGGIGIVHILCSISSKKLMSFGLGGVLVVGFFIYLVFAVLKIENVFLGICLVLVVIVILAVLKYLFNIRSDFAGDNKSHGYKNYKERRKQEALNDLTVEKEDENK